MATDRPVALVTGASSGIGAAIARQLAARGHDCIVTARREERLVDLKGELEDTHGTEIDVIAHDLGQPDSGEALVAAVEGLDKHVSVLVNNAGFGIYGPVVDNDLTRLKTMIELNMVSLTTLTRLLTPAMVEQGSGRVLQVASVGAYQPSPLYAVYSATKAYVLSFSAAMNHELKGTGVAVTTISPGLTATEFHDTANHLKPKSMDAITMSADKVAAIGLKAMFEGRSVVTPGLVNKINAFVVKLLPRAWSTAAAGKMMEKRRGGA